jgi:hypothetical protein
MRHATLVAVMLAASSATVPAVAQPLALPEYRVEAPKVHLRKCDSDATHVMMYRSSTYYVTEATARSGEIFLMHYSYAGAAHFLKKDAGSSTFSELARDRWFEQIEKSTPNYFRHVRGIPGSDCYIAERYY